jgi:WD40 repeat protein
MKISEPKFRLTSIHSDGHEENPEILRLDELTWNVNTNRRGFLTAGITAAAVLSLIGSSALVKSESKQKTAKDLFAHAESVKALAITSDDKYLISCGNEGIIKIWNLADRSLLKSIKIVSKSGKTQSLAGEAVRLRVTSDNKYFVYTAGQGSIYVYELPGGELNHRYYSKASGESIIEIDNNNNIYFVNQSSDSTLIYRMPLDTSRADLILTITGKCKITELKVSESRDILILGDRCGIISFWKLPEGKIAMTYGSSELDGNRDLNNSSISKILVDKNNELLISISEDNELIVWNFPNSGISGALIDILTLPKKNEIKDNSNEITSSIISDDTKKLIVGTSEGNVLIRSIPELKIIKEFQGHSNAIKGMVITSDGKTLITCSLDNDIKIWSLDNFDLISYLYDRKINKSDGVSYNIKNKITGIVTTYTLPCGSPIPPGAICTCNCVPSLVRVYKEEPKKQRKTNYGSTTYCRCNKICTCVPVRY